MNKKENLKMKEKMNIKLCRKLFKTILSNQFIKINLDINKLTK